MSANSAKSSGVKELVDHLREDGVVAGRKEAEKLVEEARRTAAEIVEHAELEAAKLRGEAEDASRRIQVSGQESLRLAVRDSVLRLRTEIEDRFAAQLGRMVTDCLQDPGFLERLLLHIAGQAVPSDQQVEILLPAGVPGTSEDEGSADHEEPDLLVRGLTGEMLREGVTLSVSSDHEAGLVVRVANEGLEVHLDDRSLTRLLGQHLLPRFRALLDGDSSEVERRDDRE